tara:strand:- start:397 stop:717 length:321 start_codon:yes stop_codon:yes gene_type:complete
MGGKNTVLALNRVSTAFRVDWLPLIWAARNNHMQMAQILLTYINELEAATTYGLRIDVNKAEVASRPYISHCTSMEQTVDALATALDHVRPLMHPNTSACPCTGAW